MSLLVLFTLLGVWLASSLVAYAGGPPWLACIGGVLLFPVLPLWWEHRATEAFYAQLKRATRLLPKKRALTGFTRVALRTLVINLVFLVALVALWPKVVFAALVTRGDWFLPPDAVVTRKVLLTTASGLEWIHTAANDNPYRTKQDEQEPVPETVKPVVATLTTPHGSGARWRKPDQVPDPTGLPEPEGRDSTGLSEPVEDGPRERTARWNIGNTTWPWPSTVHPVVAGMSASDETSPESVARYIASRVTDPFQRVKALHDWVVTRLRYDSAALKGKRPPQDARSVFDARTGVCEGYARLLVELGKHSGDRIVYVTGEVREEDGSLAPIGHAWNAVEVQGAWYLIDATWDDPVMSDGSDAYRTDYLFIPPKLALMNHFPDEEEWQ
ncbi:MAG TPA: transglutaminase domain-containing protein, partial [Archangium sp.]